MSNPISAHKVGLAFGGTISFWHLVWSILVGLGWAQPLINWLFRLHMIQPPYTITPFSFGSAAILIIVTAIFGYLVGFVIGSIWNRVQK